MQMGEALAGAAEKHMAAVDRRFSYVVGIDFGSTYSGFAFASVDEPERICGFTEWENQPTGANYPKPAHVSLARITNPAWTHSNADPPQTPTSIRYKKNPDGTYSSVYWGHKSKKLENRLLKTGELIEIRRFKLWFNPDVPRDGLPDGMCWLQPSIDYLSYISYAALESVRRRFGPVDTGQILWCITVPAIWDDSAKLSVRKAATLAGIVDHNNQDALCIILEPEAAALYTLKTVSEFTRSEKTTFMILDAGGGTVDLTTHIINTKNLFKNNLNNGSDVNRMPSIRNSGMPGDRSSVVSENSASDKPLLIEAARGTGGLCGSTYLDRRFLRYFRDQIGKENLRMMHEKRPELVMALLQEWERAKRDFQGMPPPGVQTVPEVLPFPAGILSFIPEDVKERWLDLYGNDEELHIPLENMADIFSEPVQQCLDLIQEQLDRCGGRCDYLVLVGGFSSSRYLYKCVTERFAPFFNQIIVPAEPTAAVVQGAVIYGLDPSRIQQRRCRKSYGYMSHVPLSEIESYAEVDVSPGSANQRFVKVFKCLVGENQEVSVNQEFMSHAFPMQASQTRVQIRLLATSERLECGRCYSMSMVEGVEHIGVLSTEVPLSLPDRLVLVRYLFGQTELKAIATILATGREQEMVFTGV